MTTMPTSLVLLAAVTSIAYPTLIVVNAGENRQARGWAIVSLVFGLVFAVVLAVASVRGYVA